MDELRRLAERTAAMEDEYVGDFAAVIARLYQQERLIATGMLACEEFTTTEDHPLLAGCRDRLRGRMRGLLAWAERTGRR